MPPKSVVTTRCSIEGVGAAFALVLSRQIHRVFATAPKTLSFYINFFFSKKIPYLMSNVTALSLDISSTYVIDFDGSECGRRLDVIINNTGAGHMTSTLQC